MKMKLFEYAILLHPASENDKAKTIILKELSTILAKDHNQVETLAAREIPAENIDSLERVEIIIRPF